MFHSHQVVHPSWLSNAGGGLLAFEHTVAQFNKYLIERKTYDAWQLGLVLTQAVNMDFSWITQLRAKDVGYIHSLFVASFCMGELTSTELSSVVNQNYNKIQIHESDWLTTAPLES